MHNSQALLNALVERVGAVQPELSLKIVDRFSRTLTPAHLVECLENDGILLQRVDEALAGLFSEEQQGEADYGDSKIFRDGPGHSLLGKVGQRGAASEQSKFVTKEQREMVGETSAPRAAKVAPGVVRTRSDVQEAYDIGTIQSLGPPPAHSTQNRSYHHQNVSSASPGLLAAASPTIPSPGAAPVGDGGSMRSGGGRIIWGLTEFLTELSLSEYIDEAAAWASNMGGAFLEEIVENSEDLADALQLKPLERRRFLKQGPAVCQAILQRRDRSTLVTKGDAKPFSSSAGGARHREVGVVLGDAPEVPEVPDQEVISAVPAPGVVPIPQLGNPMDRNDGQSEESSVRICKTI
eukprot:gnl/MRDRNA2_/MRDRNA2_56743_c0_seq1.p1 gnl/MRDRNA2_/MRDRNA2_56743_c0~~gnl/MRDRNA2_/MRDRNA2_56743_c0_seq1.p1  ORF type:complete len:351 (-),score=60.67 gnl/MRDRNA2_/MRDRNA2_56743_c0_seq1:49-1101(-)